jgi:antitoxin component YwqK of YwqJK toxin-antitoxin module
MYTREQYLEGIRQAEARNACKFNLNKAKEFFEAGDFEALHRIVVGNQDWLRRKGIISEPLSGTGETWHDNGQLESRGTFVDGNRHGVWEYFYDNGQLWARGTYVDGKAHGVWEWFHENGHPCMRGAYESGKRHGVWEWFYKNGKLFERRTYEHGRLIKTETF